MCAVFGYLDYKGKVSNAILKKLIRNLSIAAEVRGTDATGISYVNHEKVVTFKKAKPAHKVKLYFPKNTRTVIGHTRMTTQGSEKYNYNNHPFDGRCGTETFALAHNGVLYNDAELKAKYHLPKTPIETDSYVAVQLLEQEKQLYAESIKKMAELVNGSFVFTILRNDNTLFLVKGNNPLTLYHFPALELYVYASTKTILDNALQQVNLSDKCCEIDVSEGEIVEIAANGKHSKTTFAIKDYTHSVFSPYNWDNLNWYETEEQEEFLLEYCRMFGVSEEDVYLLLDYGFSADEIEEMLMNTNLLEDALAEISVLEQEDAE
ncbi:MAG: class II glutamine amidotransferase [Ruminococcus sp.]|nr:class II glutamine amidotransferase [Ruminococcus sp.]